MEITTPALLFPTISLLMLAYTNRFLGLATVIRNLHAAYKEDPDVKVLLQIDNLRRRVFLIRNMQGFGAAALLGCVLCMFLLFGGHVDVARYLFVGSLVLMMASMVVSLMEIAVSVKALDILLSDMRTEAGPPGRTGGT